ncbi:MAG TPA: TolC family protein [Puia sp.]|nr:TolC family protein [Puia sp.]
MKKEALCILVFGLFSRLAFAQHDNLDYYLDQALRNSPLLKDYQNQVESNRLDSQRILAGYKPQVTGTSFNSYAPVVAGWGYDQAISNGANIVATVGVNKTFVGQKNLNTQFNAIGLQSQSVRNSSKISEQELKRTITAQYVTAFGDLQQLRFNREVYELLQKEEGILKDLAQKNVYRQTDYLTFLVTLQQQKLLYKQLEVQFQNDYGTLNYLCGIADTATVNLQDPALAPARLPEMTTSVFSRQFDLDSLKLLNNRSLIDFGYKPRLNVFADAGYSSSLAYEAYKNFGTSFGFSVTVPIYDGHQRKIQYSRIDIQERTRSNYKDFFMTQYRQQVAQLMQQLRATEELIGQIDDQIRFSEALITANQKLLATGDAKIADYIIALNNYLNAKNLLTQNRITRLQIINQINYWNR